jgi:multidrug efflux system membrane fusion protein
MCNFFVWVVDPVSTTVAQRTVRLGIPVRDHVPVIAGLKIGEQVVAAGGAWLYAGMKVRPLAED